MSTTPDTTSEIEDRLRAALAARVALVRPEDLAPLAPVPVLRPRWQSPWVLLATAAVVLLVLGVVWQGVGRDQRSDDLAPRPDRPDGPEVTVPADVGRDWGAALESTPARVDLDGDGRKEVVEFLAEPTEDYDGRVRLQTTLTGSGEESWGVLEVRSTTIGITAEGVVDADADGDDELVVFDPDLSGTGGAPRVLDLRDGLLVEVLPDEPDLLQRGNVVVPGSDTGLYERIRVHQYWIEDGRLFSGRSEDSFARAGMTLVRAPAVVLETWQWRLDDDGVLRHEAAGCREQMFDLRECGADPRDLVPDLGTRVDSRVGPGEGVDLTRNYPFSFRLEPGEVPRVVVEGSDGRTLSLDLDVPDPRISTVQPEGVFYDGASLYVTSASDPTLVRILVQRGDRLVALEPVGEVALEDTDDTRTWLTDTGSVVSVVAQPDGTWQLWVWQMTRGDRVFAMPGGTVCLDDEDAPTAVRGC